MSDFVVKDSGERIVLSSGMQRDTTEGKTDFSLVLDGPMFDRWAEHLTKGAVKYDKRNWMKATPGDGALERFKESGLRHFLQWYRGAVDEDHASAVFFNINGAEYVKLKAVMESAQMRYLQAGAQQAQQSAGLGLFGGLGGALSNKR